MNYMEELIPLLDLDNPKLKMLGNITGEKLVEYYRNREKLATVKMQDTRI